MALLEPAKQTLFPFQAEALATLAVREVHLALTAPTGSGKGVILEILAQDPDERILLLTPLIALGRQQIRRFSLRGIPCRSTLGGERRSEVRPRVWISSPESAFTEKNWQEIRDWKPTLIAIDEAHCLKEWGENFRPAYRKITEYVKALGTSRTLWMSATFPRETLSELETTLPGNWKTQGVFRMPENLKVIEEKVSFSDRVERVRHSVLEKRTAGLIFASTRKNTEKYAALFRREGKSIFTYHAGLSDEERRIVEQTLQMGSHSSSAATSVVATNAFGMGMDYPHLDWVILAQAPLSLLGLMQSLGRVARGKREGNAEIYWAEEDFRIAGYLIGLQKPDSKEAQDLARLRRYFSAGAEEKEAILREVFL